MINDKSRNLPLIQQSTMQIPVTFDLPNYPMTELLVLRSQVNREFSRFSRTLSRGRMHISLTDDQQVVCSFDLHTKSGQKVTVSETAETLKQTFRLAVQTAQQRLRAIEHDAEQAKLLRRGGGDSFDATQLLS